MSLFILFGSSSFLFAQVATNYMFNQTAGTYNPVTAGTLLVTQTGNATSTAASLDDGVVYTIPIPFTFQFDGNDYTTCTMGNNGSVSFGATPLLPTTYGSLSATTAYSGAIAAYGRDLQGGFIFSGTRTSGSATITDASNTDGVTIGSVISGTGIAVGATVVSKTATTVVMSVAATATSTATACWVWNGEMRYEVVGTIPNRVLVMQWSNMKPFGQTLTVVNGFRMSMQVRLNEVDNSIEVVYGACSPGLVTSTATAQVGLRGPNNTFATNVNNRLVTKNVNDWLTSLPGTTNASGLVFNNVATANVIPLGLTYRWTPPPPPPPPVPANDLCANAIAISCGSLTDGYTVSATGDSAPFCGTSNTAAGVWYTIVGDGDVFTLNLCASSYDTKLSIYTGTCGSLVCVDGNDDFCGLQSEVEFLSVPGTTYYVLVHGFNTATGFFTLDVSCVPLCPAPIGAPWTVATINGSAGVGLEECDNTYTVSATGAGTTTADKLTFVYQSLSGNGYITAKINSIQPFVYGGVQFREGLTAGARKAGIATQLGSRAAREFRNVANAAHSTAQLAAPRHQWVRAARNGNVFSMSVSPDGVNWNMLSTVTMTTAPTSMNVGFYVYSQLTGLGEINFSDVTITPGLIGAQDISDRSAPSFEYDAIQAFPNPAKSELNINMGHLEGGVADVMILNSLGKIVLHQTFDQVNHIERLDVSRLTTGFYILQVNQEPAIKVTIE